ncbi:hydrolase [Actinomyces capricornis]|uniref:Hydrolase n=2 Tax=Actinomyces capricornis TaxID=2755559 RepID=A0ABN6K9W1_9ACTO|nr:hydrolase [Actinomyces capricornis]
MNISYLHVPGGRIAFSQSGSGPLVVCSPAMGDVRQAYDPLARNLADAGFRVVAADLRGHGESDATFESYGDEPTAHDLIALIEYLDAGPAILIGASMSAASAVIVAGSRPDLVHALVLIGPFLRGPAGPLGRTLIPLALRLLLLRPWGPRLWRRYSVSLWPGLTEAPHRAAELTARLRGPGRWRAFQRTARTDHRVVEPWLERVACPSLIVMGCEDPDWKDPAAEAAWAAGALGGQAARAEILMVPRAGHAPMLERPAAVSSSIISLARGCSPQGRDAGWVASADREGVRSCRERD